MTATAAPRDDVLEPTGPFLARTAGLVVAGALIGGWVGGLVAGLGSLSTYKRPVTLVAVAAPIALVVAALATVIEVPIDDTALRSSFANDRPVAATAGLVAAVLVLVTVVTIVARDRAAVAAPATPAGDSTTTRSLVPVGWDADRLRRWAPALGLGVAVVAVLALTAPQPPAATRAVAEQVRLGLGWSTEAGGPVDGTQPPLPVVVTAVAPGGATVWTALAGLMAASATAWTVRRRHPRTVALGAAALVGLGLVVLRADLAACLAAAGVALAAAVLLTARRGPANAAFVGGLWGGAVLALPVLGLSLPLLVAVVTVRPGERRAVAPGDGLAALATAVVVVWPWQRWLLERFSTWAPAAEVELPPSALLSVTLVLAVVVAGAALRPRPTA